MLLGAIRELFRQKPDAMRRLRMAVAPCRDGLEIGSGHVSPGRCALLIQHLETALAGLARPRPFHTRAL